jgi:DNA-directed RNA polymerase specialized sigma24 family protein
MRTRTSRRTSDSGTAKPPAEPPFAAVEVAFRQVYPSLRRFAAAVADDDIDPDDLVQDALAGFLRVGPPTVNDLHAYLRTSIVHAAAHERTRLARQRDVHRQMRAAPAEDARSDYPSHVAALLQRVVPVDRALLYLLHVDGTTVSAAAMVVGLTPVATRARASRARRSLRRHLKENPDA